MPSFEQQVKDYTYWVDKFKPKKSANLQSASSYDQSKAQAFSGAGYKPAFNLLDIIQIGASAIATFFGGPSAGAGTYQAIGSVKPKS
jgi:hypothetical protein